MLGLVLAAEFGLARAERGLAPFGSADWASDRADIEAGAGRAEILCFGDSLVKTGVVPAVLEARLDRSAYNLAALGATPPTTYFLLKAALEAGARPAAIVVDAKASTLPVANYRLSVRDWSGLVGPREALRLARDDRDPGFFGLFLVHHLIPSVRVRLDVRKAVIEQVQGRPPSPAVPWTPVVARQHAVNRGGIVLAMNHGRESPDPCPGGALGAYDALISYPAYWAPHPTNLVYLDRLFALAASRGIPVFLLVPPIHPGVQARREALGLDAAYLKIVRKVRDKYANVVVVDARHAGFGHVVFNDSYHLNIDGATAMSRSLAEVIARRLDGEAIPGRWASLPPYADPPSRIAAEDLDESQGVVSRMDVKR